jgi:hypothetical protein
MFEFDLQLFSMNTTFNGRCWVLVGLEYSGDTWLSRRQCGGHIIWFRFHFLGMWMLLKYCKFLFILDIDYFIFYALQHMRL